MEEFIIYIQGLIAKEGLEKAIELIIKKFSNIEGCFLNDAILISRELHGIKNSDIPYSIANRIKNRISLNMLNLLARIKEETEVTL